jgi:hypothetical protein
MQRAEIVAHGGKGAGWMLREALEVGEDLTPFR